VPWSNWAGNQSCQPAAVDRPASVAELSEVVSRAAATGQRVKVVGSGHSFTDIACTSGRQVKLDRLARVVDVDTTTRQVTVEAGITIGALNRALDSHGMALANLGDIAYQTISGAVATATHGTGVKLGGIATQIRAVDLVAGDGREVSCSEDSEPDLFRSARVGLGALGAVARLTLQCEPAFNLHAVEEPRRVDAVMDQLDGLVDTNDHFEFFWVPHTGWALTKTNNRTDSPAGGRSRWQEVRDKILIENVAFGLACRIGRWRPSLVPRLAKAVPSSGRTEYVEKSWRVFANPRWVHFYEMEYSIPRASLPAALGAVRDWVGSSGMHISFPVEVRFTAGDDIPLSTAYGGERAYIAVHVYQGTPYEQYFRAVESIMREHDGRPHWGKLHFRTAADLAPAYPRWHEFQAARDRLDPQRTFANPYTDRVLGG
jgi:L-gulono-1,4-lactone dehydrogenase